MSYQVISRKWRPNSFGDLVGQNHVSQTLLNALTTNRLSHALLFTGPRGTGKTSSARILAKAIRCEQAKNFNPCGKCTDCLEIAEGRNIDVIEIDGASNNGVDAIRELTSSVGYRPSRGSKKVYIIDEVHMLSISAFNALLKTLEEPPDHVVFVLATTEIHKIPNTVMSRCQRYDFRLIPTSQVVSKLTQICNADDIKFSEEGLWAIAHQGGGSLRDSESLLDQVVTFSNGNVSLEQVTESLGLVDRVLILESLKALVTRDQSKVLEMVSQIYTAGLSPNIFITGLIEEIRNLLLIKISKSKTISVDLPQSEIEALKVLSKDLSEEDIHMLFDMTIKGATDISHSVEPKIVLEMLLLRMSIAPRIVNLLNIPTTANPATATTQAASVTQNNNKTSGQVDSTPPSTASANQRTPIARPQPANKTAIKKSAPQAYSANPAAQQKSTLGPTPQAKQSPTLTPKDQTSSAPQNSAPQSTANPGVKNFAPTVSKIKSATSTNPLQSKWKSLVDQIKGVNALVGAQLENTFLESLENNNVIIVIPAKLKFVSDKLNKPDFQKKLINYITTFWGPGYSIKVKIQDDDQKSTGTTIKQQEASDQSKKISNERQMVENHPLVKKANSTFKTKITKIKEIT